jgi:ABC-type antimicrobial peptide transport system permease subunit
LARGSKQVPDTEIIGVFGNARYDDVRGAFPRQTFIPMDMRMDSGGAVNVYARVLGDPRPVMARLRSEVHRVDPNLVMVDLRTLDDQVNVRLSNERLLSLLSIGFAALASLMAVIGLHGVLAFVVTRRTREIGIRMALGARKGTVIRLVMREMLPMILGGIAAGVGVGLLCGRFVETQLFGVKAYDPPVIALSIAALTLAALAAAAVPAWRASRIDPVRSMRQ